MEPKSQASWVYTVEQAADVLQVSKDVIYDELARGRLPGKKIGNLWRIPVGRLRAWIEQGPAAPEREPHYPTWPQAQP